MSMNAGSRVCLGSKNAVATRPRVTVPARSLAPRARIAANKMIRCDWLSEHLNSGGFIGSQTNIVSGGSFRGQIGEECIRFSLCVADFSLLLLSPPLSPLRFLGRVHGNGHHVVRREERLGSKHLPELEAREGSRFGGLWIGHALRRPNGNDVRGRVGSRILWTHPRRRNALGTPQHGKVRNQSGLRRVVREGGRAIISVI